MEKQDVINILNKNGIYNYFSNITEKNNIGIPFYKSYIPQPDDEIFIITEAYEYRPDLISQKFYDTPDYWWIICIANNIIDPFSELKKEKQIIIPKNPLFFL
jgi:hypothetical protein